MKRLALKVFIVFNVHRLFAGQRGADRIGAAAALHPARPGLKAARQVRFDKTLGAPRGQHLALIVGEHDQAVRVAKDVFVIGQNFLMRGLYQ